MSIFRRDSEPTPEPPALARADRPAPRPPVKEKSAPKGSTHIANGSRVVGQISGAADLFIDGVVEGEIHLESQVVVGGEGRVEGKIFARSVEVAGKVLGNVQGGERVEVLATGSLEGDVLSPRVVIAEGAFFKGKVEMTDKIASRPPVSRPTAPAPAASSPPAASPGTAAISPPTASPGTAGPAAPRSGSGVGAAPIAGGKTEGGRR